jgi:hypothetical protein
MQAALPDRGAYGRLQCPASSRHDVDCFSSDDVDRQALIEYDNSLREQVLLPPMLDRHETGLSVDADGGVDPRMIGFSGARDESGKNEPEDLHARRACPALEKAYDSSTTSL